MSLPEVRTALRVAAPDAGCRPRIGLPGVPLAGGGAAIFDLRRGRVRDRRIGPLHLSAITRLVRPPISLRRNAETTEICVVLRGISVISALKLKTRSPPRC